MSAPVRIENDPVAGVLRLYWQEGDVAVLPHPLLRNACRCARCRAATLAGQPVVAPASVRLRQIGDMGYGVQLVFDDGHQHGIFPWSYLRSLAALPD